MSSRSKKTRHRLRSEKLYYEDRKHNRTYYEFGEPRTVVRRNILNRIIKQGKYDLSTVIQMLRGVLRRRQMQMNWGYYKNVEKDIDYLNKKSKKSSSNIRVRKGGLGNYKIRMKDVDRRSILTDLVDDGERDVMGVIRGLQARKNLMNARSPKIGKVYQSDIDYIRKRYNKPNKSKTEKSRHRRNNRRKRKYSYDLNASRRRGLLVNVIKSGEHDVDEVIENLEHFIEIEPPTRARMYKSDIKYLKKKYKKRRKKKAVVYEVIEEDEPIESDDEEGMMYSSNSDSNDDSDDGNSSSSSDSDDDMSDSSDSS